MAEAVPAALTPLYEQPVLVVDPSMEPRGSHLLQWMRPGASW